MQKVVLHLSCNSEPLCVLRKRGVYMKVKLKAPDGYLYYDALTDRYYSEVITDNRARYTLVPASQKGE